VRLLISGYYGFGNVGDEALLRIIVERIRARVPNADIEVLSATPLLTARELDVRSPSRDPRMRRRSLRRRRSVAKCDELAQLAVLCRNRSRGRPSAAEIDDFRAVDRTVGSSR
jgi:polysaccharide pyruvyl transferase WcaK-like protein